MTIHREHGKIVFECDACGDDLQTQTKDFTEAREVLNEEGWRSKKNGETWEHYCAGCRL